MADLIDRLSGESENLPTPRPKLSNHQFIAGLRLYANGKINRSELANNWDLTGNEATQATTIADAIDTAIIAGLAETIEFVSVVESIAMLIEDDEDTIYHTAGSVNKAKVATDLGL